MEIYAISDLHLSPHTKGHYSSHWGDHKSRLREHWDERVPKEALVLMPGDFSWHQDLEDLYYDLAWIDERPGKLKLLTPGNHDYGEGWQSLEAAEKMCSQFKTLKPLMGNAIRLPNPYQEDTPGLVIAGCRGTQAPNDTYFDTNAGTSAKAQDPERIRLFSELIQLKKALTEAQEIREEKDGLVLMIHYPPFANAYQSCSFNQAIEAAGVGLCVYGHLHQERQWLYSFQGKRDKTDYRFVGADYLNFRPTRIGKLDKYGILASTPERRIKVEWVWEDNNRYAYQSKDRPYCAECKKEIKEKDTYHHTAKGPIHGAGSFAQVGTCYRVNEEEHKIRLGPDGSPLYCAECAEPILVHEDFHFTSSGAHHGQGGFELLESCPFKVFKELKSEITEPDNPTEKIQAEPEKQKPKCFECELEILENESNHLTSKGFIHGKGSYHTYDTCALAKSRKGKDGKPKGPEKIAPHETKYVYSKLKDSERRELENLAANFLNGELSQAELEESMRQLNSPAYLQEQLFKA